MPFWASLSHKNSTQKSQNNSDNSTLKSSIHQKPNSQTSNNKLKSSISHLSNSNSEHSFKNFSQPKSHPAKNSSAAHHLSHGYALAASKSNQNFQHLQNLNQYCHQHKPVPQSSCNPNNSLLNLTFNREASNISNASFQSTQSCQQSLISQIDNQSTLKTNKNLGLIESPPPTLEELVLASQQVQNRPSSSLKTKNSRISSNLEPIETKNVGPTSIQTSHSTKNPNPKLVKTSSNKSNKITNMFKSLTKFNSKSSSSFKNNSTSSIV